MIQHIAQKGILLGRRRVSIFLFVICLNLALVPCTMALEIIEQGHDCCPPEIQIEPTACCELDDVSVDARSGTIKVYDSPDVEALPAPELPRHFYSAQQRQAPSVDPPDPPGESIPLRKLFCVYLN